MSKFAKFAIFSGGWLDSADPTTPTVERRPEGVDGRRPRSRGPGGAFSRILQTRRPLSPPQLDSNSTSIYLQNYICCGKVSDIAVGCSGVETRESESRGDEGHIRMTIVGGGGGWGETTEIKIVFLLDGLKPKIIE